MKLAVGLFLATGAASASSIAIFANNSFTGAPNPTNLSNALTNLGHTTSTFSSTTNWAANLGAANLAIIPDLDNDLFAALTVAQRSEIASFVSSGRNLLVTGGSANTTDTNGFLNGIFGFAVVATGSAFSSIIDNAAATGTPFAAGPASLGPVNQVFGHTSSSLPGGALNLYHNATNSAVWTASFGAGKIVYLGHDWFTGTDANWNNVLGRAVSYAATDIPSNVPEPGAIGLTAAALALAVFRRRSS
ncbi:MAG: PEP-CTERM sorting domain-containing protein [Bryobacterales bacterium]|nr:PEP-CTERM sorting domain-containing protein [Bryobacterales bacterium]